MGRRSQANRTAARARTEETERSMPAVMITTVIPQARIP
jgi:hypothetical protein